MSSLQSGPLLSFLAEQPLRSTNLTLNKAPGALFLDLLQIHPHLGNWIHLHNGMLRYVLVLMTLTKLEDVILAHVLNSMMVKDHSL